MNEAQFEALSKLLKQRAGSASRKALRMVLVKGEAPETAAAACLIQESHVLTLLRSSRRVMEGVQLLQGVELPPAP